MVLSYLRHHYIMRRSIVVILDETYSSFYFYKQAHDILRNLMN